MDLEHIVGVSLIGGPDQIDGHKGAYNVHELGGWPLPDYLAALVVMNRVAVALPVRVPAEFRQDVTMYRKISESAIADAEVHEAAAHHVMRGATYEAMA